MDRAEYEVRAKGLSKRGSDLPWAKMTEAQVIEARETYARAQFSVQYIQSHYFSQGLAAKYGISQGAMEKILRRNTWSPV